MALKITPKENLRMMKVLLALTEQIDEKITKYGLTEEFQMRGGAEKGLYQPATNAIWVRSDDISEEATLKELHRARVRPLSQNLSAFHVATRKHPDLRKLLDALETLAKWGIKSEESMDIF